MILGKSADLFLEVERYRLADQVIGPIIKRLPGNKNEIDVLTKVVVINSLYATSIYDVVSIAKHIVSLDLDEKLIVGDLSVVKNIRRGHEIRTKAKGTEIDFYSFATKYANFHKPNFYPIFDNLVKKLVAHLNEEMKFHRRFAQTQLLDYTVYKDVIDSLMQTVGRSNVGYKEFDQGLWVYAKYRFDQDKLPGAVQQGMERIIARVNA